MKPAAQIFYTEERASVGAKLNETDKETKQRRITIAHIVFVCA